MFGWIFFLIFCFLKCFCFYHIFGFAIFHPIILFKGPLLSYVLGALCKHRATNQQTCQRWSSRGQFCAQPSRASVGERQLVAAPQRRQALQGILFSVIPLHKSHSIHLFCTVASNKNLTRRIKITFQLLNRFCCASDMFQGWVARCSGALVGSNKKVRSSSPSLCSRGERFQNSEIAVC